MTNHLQFETSPYLLQHANNPVDWYPWGNEAISLAKSQNKPIFLSIGYSACHWCHVMEKESFSNTGIAAFLKQHFISIKVDREERPDLDAIYMDAVISMTGSGGWPMSVFLTPDLKPFYAGTYFPPLRFHNNPSFLEVLTGISDLWSNNQKNAEDYANKLVTYLDEKNNRLPGKDNSNHIAVYESQPIVWEIEKQYDWQNGGWGPAPKFPQAMVITYLLGLAAQGDQSAIKMSTHALDAMSTGGMYDLIGGGFHRYSTVASWYTPHFEKMLYDNALLTRAYLYAYKITGNRWYKTVIERTLSFVEREMLHPGGGFYSSLDADSDGEEGTFYTWTEREIKSALSGHQSSNDINKAVFSAGYYQEGRIIPRLSDHYLDKLKTGKTDMLEFLAAALESLQSYRHQKVRPGLDDKIITSWNGLMLWTFAEAGRYLDNPHYLEIASRSAEFLLSNLFHEGVLYRVWRNGIYKQSGFLEDYTSLVLGLLALYQSDLNLKWYHAAKEIFDLIPDRFFSPDQKICDTPAEAGDELIFRPASLQDNAFPSGSAMLVQAMALFSEFEESNSWVSLTDRLIKENLQLIFQYPLGFGQWLQAVDFHSANKTQVALIWPGTEPVPQEILKETWRLYSPYLTLAGTNQVDHCTLPGILHGKPLVNQAATIYVCKNFTCHAPVTSLDDYQRSLNIFKL